MNLTKHLVNKIENRLFETKNPCKLYKTEEAAEKAADKMAAQAAEHFGCKRPANYILLTINSVGKADFKGQRFAVAFDLNGLLARPEAHGGYVGIFAQAGFYNF